jgi:CubicO group peptidase (beta-lactamase class C family)
MSVESLALIEEWPVPTAAAAVVRADGTVLGAHGPTSQRFALASVTKPLTAYAALVAYEEGAVDLDEAAGPEGSTVRHLLAHTSGLAFDEHRVTAPPGLRRLYSNAGFEQLGEHLAKATDIPFGEYLKQAVLEPLGMTSTTFDPAGDDVLAPRAAPVARAAEDGLIMRAHGLVGAYTSLHGSPAKDGVSTVDDLVRFAAEVQAPRLLDPRTVAEAMAVQYPGTKGVLPGYGHRNPNDWGLGFEIRDSKAPHWTGSSSSPRTFGHFGQSGTFLWIDPDAGVACVALTDRAFGQWAAEVWPAFTDAVLAELRGR